MAILNHVSLIFDIISLLLGLYHINKTIKIKKEGDRIGALYELGFAIVFLVLAFN